MKFLSNEESFLWCKEHSLMLNEESRLPLFPEQGPLLSFLKPDMVKQLEILSRYIADWFEDQDDILCWITDWALYKEEQMAFFTRWRKGYGETKQLIDAPGQIFQQGEKSEIAGLLFLLMVYEWDCFIIPTHGKAMFFMSHDGVMSIYHKDSIEMREIKNTLVGYGVVATFDKGSIAAD